MKKVKKVKKCSYWQNHFIDGKTKNVTIILALKMIQA